MKDKIFCPARQEKEILHRFSEFEENKGYPRNCEISFPLSMCLKEFRQKSKKCGFCTTAESKISPCPGFESTLLSCRHPCVITQFLICTQAKVHKGKRKRLLNPNEWPWGKRRLEKNFMVLVFYPFTQVKKTHRVVRIVSDNYFEIWTFRKLLK